MKNKVLIGIIIVLVGVIIAEGVYLFTSKKEENENNSYINIPKEEEEENESNDNETSEDYVKLVNTKEEDNQVIQEYEMVLNGEYQEFIVEFSYEQEANHSNSSNTVNYLNGKFKDNIVYSEIRGETLSISYINRMFSSQNFTIIKGEDKNYLAVATFEREDYGDFMYYQIYNDSFDYIDSISLYVGNQSIENDLGFDGYQNVFADIYYLSEEYYSVRGKIEDNHIYELAYVCDDVYYGILEERVYTINHDKLEYEVINTYTDLEIAGATC